MLISRNASLQSIYFGFMSVSPGVPYMGYTYPNLLSGPRVKLVSCKSALNSAVVYSTDSSKAMVRVLVLLFVALWFILRGDFFYVLPWVILFLYFSVLLALRLTRLGKRELILVFFRLFVGFVLVWICRFPLPLGIWEGLRFVIVALPRLFSYLFYIRYSRASLDLSDFNYRNKALTAKLLRQGYCYFKLRKAFSKFYRRHSAWVEKFSGSLKHFCNKVYRNQNLTLA